MSSHGQKLLARSFWRSVGILAFVGSVFSLSPAEAAVTAHILSEPVEVFLHDEQAWKPLSDLISLQVGDQIRTGELGKVDLQCEDGSVLHLSAKTHVAINELLFSTSQKTRVFHFKLLRGTVTVDAMKFDFTRFKLTKQSLENLQNGELPDDLLQGLQSLENQEFTEESIFLQAVKAQIGGVQTARHKKTILEHADTKQNVLAIETDTVVTHVTASNGIITNLEDDYVIVTQGMFAINQINPGIVYVACLVDQQEGLTFSLQSVGVWIRTSVDVEDRKITLESNGPLAEIQALIGDANTVMKAENNPDAPSFKVTYEDNIATLAQEQAATFMIPAAQVILIEIPDFADAIFWFLSRMSFVIFADKGCVEINGEENCCGYYEVEKQPEEEAFAPYEERREEPIPETIPEIPVTPKRRVGSPILP